MAAKTPKGLGKGLGALLDTAAPAAEQITSLPLTKLEPNPLQPRKLFDEEELQVLADSITQHGIIQPIAVRKAENEVISGIRRTALALSDKKLTFSPLCRDIVREFSEYAFDEDSASDKVIKENDHAMDDMRYFVNTVFKHCA